jgi:hypothetical protein
MRNRITWLVVWVCLVLLAPAADVIVTPTDFQLSSATGRRVTLTPTGSRTDGSVITTIEPRSLTVTNASVTFSNTFAGTYKLDISGAPPTALRILVPDTNGAVNAATVLVTATNATEDAAGAAWSAAASDARFQMAAANLTNWAALSTNVIVSGGLSYIPQAGSANLTNWSALPTNALGSGGVAIAAGTNMVASTNAGVVTLGTPYGWGYQGANTWIWYGPETNEILETRPAGPLTGPVLYFNPLHIYEAISFQAKDWGGVGYKPRITLQIATNTWRFYEKHLEDDLGNHLLRYETNKNMWLGETNSTGTITAQGTLATTVGVKSPALELQESGVTKMKLTSAGDTLTIEDGDGNYVALANTNSWQSIVNFAAPLVVADTFSGSGSGLTNLSIPGLPTGTPVETPAGFTFPVSVMVSNWYGFYVPSISALDYRDAARAQTFFMSTTGSDAADGLTVSTPKATLSNVVATATASFRVYIAAGAYATVPASETNLVTITTNATLLCTNGFATLGPIESTNSLHVENCTFISGIRNALRWTNADADARLSVYRCTFGPSTEDGFAVLADAGLVVAEESMASSNRLDGFNYHKSGASTLAGAIEIRCVGMRNGTTGGTANNGSTIHDGFRIIRVNGQYFENENRNIHDIGAGGMSWNLGCVAGASLLPGADSDVGFAVGVGADNTMMWLQDCGVVGGSVRTYNYGDGSATLTDWLPRAPGLTLFPNVAQLTVSSNVTLGTMSLLAADTYTSMQAEVYRTRLGYRAGQSTGTSNNAVQLGGYAGQNSTTAIGAVQVGALAGQYSSTANSAVQVGYEAGIRSTTATGAVQVGQRAGQYQTAGTYAVAVGFEAAAQASNSTYSVNVGYRAGLDATPTTGSVFIGANADGPSNATATNAIAIGHNAAVTNNNQTVIGNANTTQTVMHGVVTGNGSGLTGLLASDGYGVASSNWVLGQIASIGTHIYSSGVTNPAALWDGAANKTNIFYGSNSPIATATTNTIPTMPANSYIRHVKSSVEFSRIAGGPVTVKAYLAKDVARTVSVAPEFYFLLGGTNLVEIAAGLPQAVASTTPTLMEWSVSITETNLPAASSLVWAWKVSSSSGSGNLYFVSGGAYDAHTALVQDLGTAQLSAEQITSGTLSPARMATNAASDGQMLYATSATTATWDHAPSGTVNLAISNAYNGSFEGNGNALTNLPSPSNVTNAIVYAGATAVLSVNNDTPGVVSGQGSWQLAQVTATNFVGNAGNLTNIPAGNLASGTNAANVGFGSVSGDGTGLTNLFPVNFNRTASASFAPVSLAAMGTNIWLTATNGPVQKYTLTNSTWFTVLDSNTNNIETIRLELTGSNYVSFATTYLSNAVVCYPTNGITVLLFDRSAGTNLWWASRLR